MPFFVSVFVTSIYSLGCEKIEMSRKITNNTEAAKASEAAEEPPTKRARAGDIEEAKALICELEERIGTHDDNRVEVQEKLHKMCDEWRKQIDLLEDSINEDLEAKFREEENCLQEALNDLRIAVATAEEKRDSELSEAVKKARAELLVTQTYKLVERIPKLMRNEVEEDKNEMEGFTKRLELEVEKKVDSKMIDLSSPTDLEVTETSDGRVHIRFVRNVEQERVLSENGFGNTISYIAEMKKKGTEKKR